MATETGMSQARIERLDADAERLRRDRLRAKWRVAQCVAHGAREARLRMQEEISKDRSLTESYLYDIINEVMRMELAAKVAVGEAAKAWLAARLEADRAMGR